MRRSLVSVLRCPRCGSRLSVATVSLEQGGWIEQGELQCTKDASRYVIRRGIVYLHDDGERWQVLSREAAGWVRMHQDRGMYGGAAGEVDFTLPYWPEPPWIEISGAFDVALDIIQPRRGLRVLEVGAGRGWAARHLAIRGCDVTAVEINDDLHVGLGRVLALAERSQVQVDPLIGDSEHLPLAEGSYDVVFASAAIHHSSSFDAILRSVARVLRRGGRLVAINEPCVPDAMSAEALAANIAEETAYDINENHGRLGDYRKALRGSGLREIGMLPWQAYRMPANALTTWSQQLGVEPPPVAELAAVEARWSPTRSNRWRERLAQWRGDLHPKALPPAAWCDSMLRICGGSLVIIAERW